MLTFRISALTLGTDSGIFLLDKSRVYVTCTFEENLYNDYCHICEKSSPDHIEGTSHQVMHFLEKQETRGRTNKHFPGSRDYFNKAKNRDGTDESLLKDRPDPEVQTFLSQARRGVSEGARRLGGKGGIVGPS